MDFLLIHKEFFKGRTKLKDKETPSLMFKMLKIKEGV